MEVSSYCTNWWEFEQEFNTDTSSLSQAETQLIPPEMFVDNFELQDPFCNNIDHNLFGMEPFVDNFILPDSFCNNIDHDVIETNDFFYSENCNSLFPDLSTPNDYNFNNILQEYEPFHCPKRQKTAENHQPFYSDFNIPGPGLLKELQDYKPELIAPPLADFATAPLAYNGGSFDSAKKQPSSVSLSAQSIAARQRRRKISEKTQQLGKLIPGGNRMNTAEMLQSAYKYIKFLQAQVMILELMDSSYDKDNQSEGLHAILESRLVQEKLYSNEKCLVPEKFVEEVTNDHQILESKPQIVKELRKLANTNLSH